ncbi:PfkB family carbohydrate kinase [Cellulomonas sp. NS3]|uniref:PfkB family carbohydrate kinase n=1 Tax=Cellulomonas sp. NS3 TaxID=2973977 RepID=UPI002163179E|nr:PfkB family carbohydrate kinase [Cellulomonas sp. NS3]
MTRGALGAYVLTRQGPLEVTPVPVAVADTVGAGDSFMAALLDGLALADLLGAAHRDELRAADRTRITRALTRATRAAALTVSRPGADLPTATDLADSPPARPARTRTSRHNTTGTPPRRAADLTERSTS